MLISALKFCHQVHDKIFYHGCDKGRKTHPKNKDHLCASPHSLHGLFFFFLVFPQLEGLYSRIIYHSLYCAIRCERTNQTRIETDFPIHFISQGQQHHLILPQDITLLAIRIHGVSTRTCCIRGRAVALRLVPLSARTEVVDVAAWG